MTANYNIIPFAATAKDLVRKSNSPRTLNSMVEELFLRLFDDPEFHALQTPLYNAQAVHGSLRVDDVVTAQMVQTSAKALHSPVKDEKVATIMKSLRQVKKKFHGLSRSERRKAFDSSSSLAYEGVGDGDEGQDD